MKVAIIAVALAVLITVGFMATVTSTTYANALIAVPTGIATYVGPGTTWRDPGGKGAGMHGLDSLPIVITHFSSVKDNRPVLEETTWGQLRAKLTTFEVREHKGGALWSPVSYKPNTTRANANVEHMFAAVLDVDDGADPQMVHGHLTDLGVEHVVHSTFSSTPEKPKFRVIVPFVKPVPAEKWASLWPALCDLLTEGHTDRGTKDPARLFFWPTTKPGGKTFTYSGHGRALDPDAIPTSTRGELRDFTGMDLEPDGKLPPGRHYEWLRAFTASLASRTPRIAVPQLVATTRGAFTMLANDLTKHEKQIVNLALTAVSKFGKPATVNESTRSEQDGVPPETVSKATRLVEIARASAELFHDASHELYASVRVGDHTETFRLRSTSFKRWLVGKFYGEESEAPGREALSSALATIEAIAEHEGSTQSVYTRIGVHEGAIWMDLGDPDWHAIRAGADGWTITDGAPIPFVRGRNATALPLPVRGGSLTELMPFLNATQPDDPHFVLAVAFLLGTFLPAGPFPVLEIHGEQGSGKTFASTRIVALTDPSSAPLRSVFREERDLAVSARNSRVLVVDNVSLLPAWLSDALCRLATGGGFSTRQLYTDDDEISFNEKRPVIITGVSSVIEHPDLRDRALLAEWPHLRATLGKTEADLIREFSEASGRIFGAILDAVVLAVRDAAKMAVPSDVRMRDFAGWVAAAEPALPWLGGTFLRVYTENRADASATIVTENVVGDAVISMLNNNDTFTGTATELHQALGAYATPVVDPDKPKPRGWPADGRRLSAVLDTLKPGLRRLGVEYERLPRTGRGRPLALRRVGDSASLPSPASQGSQRCLGGGDGDDDSDAGYRTRASPQPLKEEAQNWSVPPSERERRREP